MDSTGRLSQDFINTIESYEFDYHGYIILDGNGISTLFYWLTGNTYTDQFLTMAAVNPHLMLMVEEQLLNQLCSQISNPDTMQQKNPPWQELTASHMVSNLDMETIMLTWSQITNDVQPPTCEVIHRQ